MLRALTESECPNWSDPFQPGHVFEGQDLIPPAFGSWRDHTLYSRRVDTSTTSRASLALATVWLNNCRRNHHPCRVFQEDGTLPRRIINISSPELWYLEEGQDRKEDYVTLSYKWGGCQKYTTTSLNLQQHQTEIPSHKLPLTFREAIGVARALGFQWIWIDALCIVQDLDTDKASEINKMDQIFRSSFLTLFAAAGDSADAGLSAERDPRQAKPCLLELQTTAPRINIVKEKTLELVEDFHAGWHDKPLYERGWVLQEEVLAPRRLIFEPGMLVFHCVCGASNEQNPAVTPPVTSIQDLVAIPDSRRYADLFTEIQSQLLQEDDLSQSLIPRSSLFQNWYHVVASYSRRALTSSDDVLPALAGLANALRKRHNWTYLSGLWKEDLQRGLFWTVTNEDPDEEATGHVSVDASKTLEEPGLSVKLPSWSWGSVWGTGVFFEYGWRSDPVVTLEDVQLYDGLGVTSCTLNALKLTGRVRRARIGSGYATNGDPIDTSLVAAGLHDTITGGLVGRVHFDVRPDVKQTGRVVYCLLVARTGPLGWYITDRRILGCLALEPVDEWSGVFRRVGLAFIMEHSERWFEQDYWSTGQDFVRTITLV